MVYWPNDQCLEGICKHKVPKDESLSLCILQQSFHTVEDQTILILQRHKSSDTFKFSNLKAILILQEKDDYLGKYKSIEFRKGKKLAERSFFRNIFFEVFNEIKHFEDSSTEKCKIVSSSSVPTGKVNNIVVLS